MTMKTYGLVSVIVVTAWLFSIISSYITGPVSLFLFVFFEGANVSTLAGLVGLTLYEPPEISFRFPRLYISIFSYLASVLLLGAWRIQSNMDTFLYTGVVLTLLGTISLVKGLQRIPSNIGSVDIAFMESPHPGGDVPTVVDGRWYNPGLQGRHLVRFERGLCFLTEPGKRISWIKPRQVLRTDTTTVKIETGWWKYGTLTLRFGSPSDAGKAEENLRRITS